MEDSYKMTTDNAALVEEMMRDAVKAEEPGSLKQGDVIPAPKDSQIALGVNTLKSAGYVILYDTQSGEPSKINRNMLAAKLKQTRPDGKPVFSTKQLVKPIRGIYKCLLHSDDPNRPEYNKMGLPVCRKANLTNPYEVRRHMQKRHKTAWEAIEEIRINKEKLEDREFQRSIVMMAGGKILPTITPTTSVEPLKAENVENTGMSELETLTVEPRIKRKYKKHKHRVKKE